MPVTVRIAFPLALLSLLLLFVLPPSARYLRLVTSDTLPRLRQPTGAKKLARGIPADQWARDWVPLEASQANRSLSLREDRKRLVLNIPVVQLGRRWFELMALFYGWVVTFMMSLWVYILAMTVSRRLLSSLPSLILALGLLMLLLFIGMSPISAPSGTISPLTSFDLSRKAWTPLLFVFAVAIFASFLPFSEGDPRPNFFQRFMALLRDVSFFSLPLLSLLIYLTALDIQGRERGLAFLSEGTKSSSAGQVLGR